MDGTAGDATPPRVCLRCGKPLQKIGRARKNGARHHGDWAARRLHKACWAAMQPKRRSFAKNRGRKPFKPRRF